MSLNPRITDWTGRVVWLIGASTGIGRATAELLHARGAKVVVSARNAAALSAFESAHPGSLGLALTTPGARAVPADTLTVLYQRDAVNGPTRLDPARIANAKFAVGLAEARSSALFERSTITESSFILTITSPPGSRSSRGSSQGAHS